VIHLLVPFYVDAREPRRKEIEDAVRRNLRRTEFDSVTLFCEEKEVSAATALAFKFPKARVFLLPRRALYTDLLQHAKKNALESDVVVIANADVYFDDTITLAKHVQAGHVLCLTRSEQRPFDEGLYWPEAETSLSHDAWIFRPPLNIPGEFEFGRPGCEIRFAGECEKAGYALLNPCRQIHAIHNHASGLRTYTAFGPLHVSGPYAHVYITPEWPPRPPVVKKEDPVPTRDDARTRFVRECVAAQLSGLWTNAQIASVLDRADHLVAAMFDMAERAAREAERRGMLP
jgi:hypothetical protein